MRKYIVTIITILISNGIYAQFVNLGQSPSSIKWKQINTENFQLIYPDFFEDNAQKLANIYHKLYEHSNTLGTKPKKMSIIVHAHGGLSNGNVGLAPRKNELYATPEHASGDNWLEHLAIHESRHIVQYDKLNQGLTKVGSFILGEIAPIAVFGIQLPMWFVEGDATVFESSVCNMGRGRSPEFLNEMKAQIVEQGVYDYYKSIHGSLNDYVPGYYNMGYFMTANARKHYGADIWERVMNHIAKKPYYYSPFTQELKRVMREKRDSLWQDSDFRANFVNTDSVKASHTVKNARHLLYKDNFAELKQIWTKESNLITHNFDTLETNNKYFTNYYYPTLIGKDSVISFKQGFQDAGEFVLHNNDTEELITRTAYLSDQKFAYNNSIIVWSEYNSHPRWAQGGRMQLSSYSISKQKYNKYKCENNCFAPFAVDNNWGYVEVDNNNQAYIVVKDSKFQKEIVRIKANVNELFIHPSYSHYNKRIITAIQSPDGMYLASINLENSLIKKLTEVYKYQIDNPIALDSEKILFRASFNTNNAFYIYENGNIEQVVESKFGVRFPTINNDKLNFSFYTSTGYKVGQTKINELESKKAKFENFELADLMKQQENWTDSLVVDSTFNTSKYKKFGHLLNVHSWAPFAVNLNEMDFDLAATIYAQNKLNTLLFYAGYGKISGYEYGRWFFDASYEEWLPKLSTRLETGRNDYNDIVNPIAYNNIPKFDSTSYVITSNKAQNTTLDLIAQVPLTISTKQFNRSINPYVKYVLNSYHNKQTQQAYLVVPSDSSRIYRVNPLDYPTSSKASNIHIMEYGLIFSNSTRKTVQEINPRWGQVASVGYAQTLSYDNLFKDPDDQYWGSLRMYFPSFTPNHSISTYIGYQNMLSKRRSYSNKISYPRGIKLGGYELTTIRSSYEFPIAYTDMRLSTLAYFRNINGAVFYDWGRTKDALNTQTFSSAGIEITSDMNFFTFTFPINLGTRIGYETQNKKMFAEFLFSVGLSI